MLFDIPLRNITAEDILNLEREAVFEGKHLDYKECVYVDNPHGKDEFRKDVTALANASGGDIIMGIKEFPCADGNKKGEVVGLEGSDKEGMKERLFQILKDWIQPRVPGVDIKDIDISGRKLVIIVRVPRSFNQPHQVTMK